MAGHLLFEGGACRSDEPAVCAKSDENQFAECFDAAVRLYQRAPAPGPG